jgi:hypothetical protein
MENIASMLLSELTQVVMPLTCIQEVDGSDLGWDIGYPEVSNSFSSVPPGKCQDSIPKLAATAYFHISSNSSLTNHPII